MDAWESEFTRVEGCAADWAGNAFVHVPNGHFDLELFRLLWSPTISSLCLMFDSCTDEAVLRRSISGLKYALTARAVLTTFMGDSL